MGIAKMSGGVHPHTVCGHESRTPTSPSMPQKSNIDINAKHNAYKGHTASKSHGGKGKHKY